MAKALNLLLALTVAVPLGGGGFCCCVLGDDCGVGMVAAAPIDTGAHDCCAHVPAAAPPPAADPAADPADDGCCDCPEREAALRAAGPVIFALAETTGGASPPSALLALPVFAAPLAGGADLAEPRSRFRSSLPPPGRAVHQVISVYLC
jgi:hypothetical protein